MVIYLLMNNCKLFLVSALCFAIISCNKDNSYQEQHRFSFQASLEPSSKTVLDNKISYWDGKECIAVFDNHGVKKEFEGTASKQSKLSFTEKDESTNFTGSEYYAVYPSSAAETAEYSGSKISGLVLKRDQLAVALSYDPSVHIAFANSSTTSLSFLNAVSLFAFSVEDEGITEVRISANADGEYLAGSFEYDYATKTSSLKANQSSYVSIKGSFEVGKTYYAAVLPLTFSSGLSIEPWKDGIAGKKKSSSASFELSRNHIVNLGSIKFEQADAISEKTSSHSFASPDFGLEGEVGAELYKNSGPAVEGDVNWYLKVDIGEPIYFWKGWGLQIGIGWHDKTAFHVDGMTLSTSDIKGRIKSVSVNTSDSDTIDNSELYVLVGGVQFGDIKTLKNDMTKFTFSESSLPSGKIDIIWKTNSGGLSYYLQSVEVVYQE